MMVSGHRPQSLPGGFKNTTLHTQIKKWINQVLRVKTPEVVYTGMALGFDTWVAEECLKLAIPFITAIPFDGQDNRWLPQSRQHYQYLLSKASMCVMVDRMPGYISDEVAPGVYAPMKMIIRNNWMVDQLHENDFVFSLYDGRKSGGTYQCIEYTNSKPFSLSMISIHPVSMITREWSGRGTSEDIPF